MTDYKEVLHWYCLADNPDGFCSGLNPMTSSICNTCFATRPLKFRVTYLAVFDKPPEFSTFVAPKQ